MHLYLLRHGQSLANHRNLVCGSLDFALSEKGKLQARQACVYLQQKKFTRIYTSPLSRAVETIASLDKEVPVSVEPEIMELNTGSVSNMTLPELWESDVRFKKPWLSPDLRYPGGETFREMVSRIAVWYDKHSKDWTEDDAVLVVGHEGTLRSIYSKVMGVSLTEYPDFPIGNCDYLYFYLRNGDVLNYIHVSLEKSAGSLK